MVERLPGAKGTGALGEDEEARERFCAAFETVACPVLDPETGGCLLYHIRPLSCRSYGEEGLPPCRLNFQGATEGEIAAESIEPDRGDLEGELLERLGAPDTVIAAALALDEPQPRM